MHNNRLGCVARHGVWDTITIKLRLYIYGKLIMTDRTISLLVTLDKEYRTDDAEFVINAIKMIKGVLEVQTNIADPFEDCMQRQSLKIQAKHEILERIHKFFAEV
jgi:hypothetical protein